MSREVLVIPDTCADIIIEIDHTACTITSRLCGLADSPKRIEQKPVRENVTTFAVRFFFFLGSALVFRCGDEGALQSNI